MTQRNDGGPALVPCPVCGSAPHRFFAGQERIEVIACPKGCKPNWNSVVIHITSRQVKGCGWEDLGDAWNTIRLERRDDGLLHGCFDQYPSGKQPAEIVGRCLEWSPELSKERLAARERT